MGTRLRSNYCDFIFHSNVHKRWRSMMTGIKWLSVQFSNTSCYTRRRRGNAAPHCCRNYRLLRYDKWSKGTTDVAAHASKHWFHDASWWWWWSGRWDKTTSLNCDHQVMYEHGEPLWNDMDWESSWFVHQSSLAILPVMSSGSKQE
jgi:hypothetical protein